jgi:uncharacterized membrane protein required for colicin V production
VTAVFVIRGLARGTLSQVFAFIGIALGVLTASAVADVVGFHWSEAEPRIAFGALRWLVAALAGLGVAALLQWWGGLLAKAVHDGPFGWLDRTVGALVGLTIGTVVSTAFLVLLLQAPGLEFARTLVARGVTSAPLLAAGERASEWGRSLPGGLWLHEQLRSASRRLAARRQA